MDFDCGAIRGYVLNVDPKCFTKSQSTRCAENVQHPVMHLLACSNDPGNYVALEGGCLWFFHLRHIDERVVPLPGIKLLPLCINGRGYHHFHRHDVSSDR